MSWFSFKFARSRRGIITLCAVLILLLFLVRPEVERLRSRIVSSISLALGRPVEISSVTLHFLPQPGFDLQNFVVYDEPAFSAEPILRAQEVRAVLRVTSLFRGHLEIARLSLSEPSLNLVRNNQGRWNLGNLVERAAKIPVAPTGKAKSEPRPGFPYIEVSNGRINFKLGQEKKAYVLTDADFSVWQDSENTWGMRLKAQPLRTDFNLTDTGTLRAEGSWQRSEILGQTPLRFNLQWERAQLGQFTKFATGMDRGWRGTILITATVTGTPADLSIETSASVDDFRRYDIMGGQALRLAAQCSGHYDSIGLRLTDLACRAPVGTGLVEVSGGISGLSTSARSYDLTLSVHEVPMPALVALAQHAKKNIPNDLVSSGKLDANIKLQTGEYSSPKQEPLQGGGSIQGCRLLSSSTNTDLVLDRIPFAIAKTGKSSTQNVSTTRVEVGPFHLPLGAPASANVKGWLSGSAYNLQIQGDAKVKRLLQLARTVGVSSIQPSADGIAKVDLQIAGEWNRFQPAGISGKAQLSSVHADIGGVNSPLEIASATVLLHPSDATVQNVSASLGGSTWSGSLTVPRMCVDPRGCPIHFDFLTKELTTDQLVKAFIAEPRKQPWYRFLSSSEPGWSYLTNLNAEGTLGAARVVARQLTASQVSAKVTWRNRRLQISDLRGSILGGTHSGDWEADFSSDSPQYSGKGFLQHIALGQLAQAMHDGWVTGTASGSYQLSATGATTDEFLSSLRTTLDADARDTLLPHVVLTSSAAPLFARRFVGRLLSRDGKLEIRDAKLETPSGIYQISGTAIKGRSLNMQMLRAGGASYTIKGTLAEPRILQIATPETQAALKGQ